MNKYLFGAIALFSIALFGVSAAQAQGIRFANGDNSSLPIKERAWQGIDRQAIQQAITDEDYQAWSQVVSVNNPLKDIITADNFSQFAQMRQLMQSGDWAEAQHIADQLGLPSHSPGFGMGRGMHKFGERHFIDANGDGVCDNVGVINSNNN
ncbi:MAG: hypothetical protein ACKKL5_00190 [Candidatus Komeilibacteria bacterium]